jgi:hypothetical protein
MDNLIAIFFATTISPVPFFLILLGLEKLGIDVDNI